MPSKQQGEKVFLNAWLWEFHRSNPTWKRVRLGPVPNPAQAKVFSVLLRWADAVFLEGGEIVIVEAKIRPNFGAIGQLLGYKMLIKATPEFDNYAAWNVRLILLSKFPDLAVTELASKFNIEHEIWNPEGE